MVYLNIKWINTLFCLTFFWKIYVQAEEEIRLAGKSFSNSTKLGNYKVFCDKDNDDRKIYPNDAYKCTNIRVGDMRIRYINMKTYGKSNDSPPNRHDEKKYDIRNNLGSLCIELLKENGVAKKLWTVYVEDAPNGKTTNENERLIFVKTKTGYKWEITPPGNGYIRSIVCMIKDR